ncbi:MAG: crossover junction endodeoxyribonuclease RuvC [Deltaproteobacteria bacterium]|nr:crossover junction endodeoxyribonuclease RuvC [Deltaproteobacteria bacterium]
MRILGLDPGSRVCGYGVIERVGNRLTYVECGVLTAPESQPMERRLGEIARGLREVLADCAPEVVAVEDVFTHQNPRSALALAHARGMALAVVGLAGLAVASYPPASVKKAVSGSGKADKAQVARMVQALIGMASLPRADATDALAVAITHGNQLELAAAAKNRSPGAARIASAVLPSDRPRTWATGSSPRVGTAGQVIEADDALGWPDGTLLRDGEPEARSAAAAAPRREVAGRRT